MVRLLPLWTALLTVVALPSFAGRAPHSERIILTESATCDGAILIEDVHGRTLRRIPLDGRREITLPADLPHPIRVVLDSEKCWAAPIITDRETRSEREIRVWPAATIKGMIELSPSDAALVDFGAELLAIDGVVQEQARLRCSTRAMSWLCSVPGAPISVRLRARGYAPRYLLDIRIPASEHRDLGIVRFIRGGAIVGSATVAERNAKLDDIRVTLTPTYRLPMQPDAPTVTTTTTKEGLFKFEGVMPGSYEVAAAKEGWSAAHSRDIMVTDGGEVVIPRPLLIRPLATLDVRIQPPAMKDGNAWRIAIERAHGLRGNLLPIVEDTLPPGGNYRRAQLQHGRYRVSIRNSSGSVVARDFIDVDDDLAFLTLTIDQIPIEGRVTIGDEPLRATLYFSRKNGATVKFESDDHGVFAGGLSHPGKWTVRIEPAGSSVDLRTHSLNITPRGDRNFVRADISLPEGRLRGIVVDERGNPAAASVLLHRDRLVDALIETALDGTFEVFGVEPGAVAVSAMTEDAESELVAATAEKDPGESIRLPLVRHQRVRGRALTRANLPVAGALVRYTSASMYETRETISGPDGEFDLVLPRNTRLVTLAVLSPGLPAKLTTVQLEAQPRDVNIVLGGPAATLVVNLPSAPPWPLITPDMSGFVGLRFLNPPPSGSQPFINTTAEGFEYWLEPGTYTVCPEPRPSARCQQRTLSAGARSVIDATEFWTEAERNKVRERLP